MYRVIPDAAAMEQIATLPRSAVAAFAAVMDKLTEAPWTGRPYNEDKPNGPMRELVFGASGQGVATYLIVEHLREVHLLLVHWVD